MSAIPAAPVAATDEFTRGYRAWMLFMLMLMNALNLADRQGLAAIAPALKRSLSLSDTELGVIQGLGFAIFYTLLGLPLDTIYRPGSLHYLLAARALRADLDTIYRPAGPEA